MSRRPGPALAQLPRCQRRRVLIRAGSGGGTHDFLAWLTRPGERRHYLNTVPLQKLHRRWADPAAAGFASALLRLADTVEAEGRHMESNRPTIEIALDIEIAGTPAAVFAALTKDVGGWWGHPFVTARATCLALDPRLGGLFTERWDNGGQVIASVTGWAQEPARHWPRRTAVTRVAATHWFGHAL